MRWIIRTALLTMLALLATALMRTVPLAAWSRSGWGPGPDAAAAAPPQAFWPTVLSLGTSRSGLLGIHGGPQATPEELGTIAAAGAVWIRDFGISWRSVQPERTVLNWEALAPTWDRLRAAQEKGLRVIEVIYDTPIWAREIASNGCGPIKPEFLADFVAFAREVARRARLAGVRVDAWELFNEPDVDRLSPLACYGDKGDAYYGGGDYAQMLMAVYPALKTEDPATKVLIGGLLLDCDPSNPPTGKDCTPSRFLEGILRAGAAEFFDGVSFHAYDYYVSEGKYVNNNWWSGSTTTGPVVIAKARFLTDVLARYGVTGKIFMNTESALICGASGTEPPCLTDQFEQTKAAYVTQAIVSAASQGLSANVWYSLAGWRASGLVDAGGSPRPAYRAFQAAASFLGGAAFSGQVPSSQAFIYEFTRSNGIRVWVLWSRSGNGVEITLPASPIRIADYLGQALPPTTVLTVTWKPVYTEFGPERTYQYRTYLPYTARGAVGAGLRP